MTMGSIPLVRSASSRMTTVWQYFFACFLSVFFSFLILQIPNLSALSLPLDYFGDTIFYAMTIKSVITTGWYLADPSIGVPDGHFLGDFPTPEGLNYLLIKMISWFSSDWVVVLNVFFLLGFPLITASALFVLRSFSLSYPLALTGSLLFAFMPFHLIRGESHVFLSGYYLIPLAIWMAVLIDRQEKKKSFLVLGLLFSVLIGSNGVYHAFFASFFLLLSGLIASASKSVWQPLKYAAIFITVIVVSMVANIWPTIEYQLKKGTNTAVLARDFRESEECGLKIAQLLLPRDHDRNFSTLKETYNSSAVLVNENASASLGIIGSLGFVGLIGWLFFRRRDPLVDALAHLNLGAVLLGTVGGFSSLVAFFLVPQIRAYNRISVFIGFFALAAFFLFLQKNIKNPKALWACSLFLLAIGLWNQSSPMDASCVRFPQIPWEYKNDRTFVQKIEKTLPPGSMVFQLPYMHFPEGPRDRINSYAHFKCALHSSTLKWSFGAMRGRKTDRWQRKASAKPIPEMLREIVRKGFTGLVIDKFGYLDDGQAIMAELSQELKVAPIFDGHGRSFWDLRAYATMSAG